MPSSESSFRSYVNMRLEQVARTARNTANQIYRRQCGMDIQHIRVLRIVAETPGKPVSWVVREADLDRTLVSRIITRLVNEKLLERTISPEDARQVLLDTTPEGVAIVNQANILGDALNMDLLSVLDREELEVFERCLQKLSRWQPRSLA